MGSTSESSPRTPAPGRARTARELALVKPLPERVDWAELERDFFLAWGYPDGEFMPEHLEILGPNGSGKSFFLVWILKERARLRGSRIIYVCTKPADKTVSSLGWAIVEHWPPKAGWTKDQRKLRQVIFWAKAPGLNREARAKQAQKVGDLLEELWVEDSNTIIVFDEVAYVEKELDLRVQIERYWREGRALGITVVAGTQRPQGVSRYQHSESKWTVVFAPKDEEDAERVAQILGNRLYYMRVLQELDRTKHEFLLVHNLTGEAVISALPKNPIPVRIDGLQKELPKKRMPVA